MPSDVEGEVDAEAEASEGGAKVRTKVNEVQDVGMPSSHSWTRGSLPPNAIAYDWRRVTTRESQCHPM